MARPSPSQILLTSAGEPSKVRRSFSKISTPSNPTAAAACSFSGKVPLRQTVAMALGRGLKDVVIVARPSSWCSVKNARQQRPADYWPARCIRHQGESPCGFGPDLRGAASCAAIAEGRGAEPPATMPPPPSTAFQATSRLGQPCTCAGQGLLPHPVVLRLGDRHRVLLSKVVHVDAVGLPRAQGRDRDEDRDAEGNPANRQRDILR